MADDTHAQVEAVLDVLAPFTERLAGAPPRRWPIFRLDRQGTAVVPSDAQVLSLAWQIVTVIRAVTEPVPDADLVTVVVRGFGYRITHVATVPRSALEPMGWPSRAYPFTGVRTPVISRCGNRIRSCQDAVAVMREGTLVRCRHCQHITGIERQPQIPQLPGNPPELKAE